MAFRRPPPWNNSPTPAAQSRDYTSQSQALFSPSLTDTHNGSFEEEIENGSMESNRYINSMAYAFNQPQVPGHWENEIGWEEEAQDAGHQANVHLLSQEEDEYSIQQHLGMDQCHASQISPLPMHPGIFSPQQDPRFRHSENSYSRPYRPAPTGPPSSDFQFLSQLIPVSHLPDLYRGLFKKFGAFNAVQSACYDDVMNADDNLIISAPTGSGKTVLFELAIIRMQMHGMSGGKCVYIAPTKALCTEKCSDWSAKFEPLGLKCYELTGDTATTGRSLWTEVKTASIVITTGEKWDSVTRNWKDHQQMLGLVRLFLVDEVHVLGESRGSTLEVVVSRMKMKGPATRFILVSATIPNIDDIAAWIGSQGTGPAKVLRFGEEYRPCKLTKHVVGIPRRKDANSFQFDKSLNASLFSVIQTYSAGKPILIFVSTRKGVLTTAEVLLKAYQDIENKKARAPWSRPARIDAMFYEKRLEELAAVGIGMHHAGLDMDDRRSIEKLYIEKSIRVLVATSTLAVGVNLPAHFVIVKGVHLYQNGVSSEYSDLDIMQMLGRAGRPQFDTEGLAVIMCEQELVAKYQALTQGTRVLESNLHHNLSEHINSEIGLETISDVESAKNWLRGSFLYQRVRKNPRYYAIGKQNQNMGWQERMDELVASNIQKLQENQLVENSSIGEASQTLALTDYGEIMSKFCLRQNTMVEMIKFQKNATIRELLELISRSEEFTENKLRQKEKTIFNALRKHPDIRFSVKTVDTTADKVFILIQMPQAVLGGIPLNSPEYRSNDCQLHMEAYSIFRHVDRLARAVVEMGIVIKDGKLVKNALELVRSLASKAWEDRAIVLRQVDYIGEKSVKILAENGITTIEKLRTQDPLFIETLLRRTNGFGFNVIASADAIPRYQIRVEKLHLEGGGGKRDVEIEISIDCRLLNTDLGRAPESRNFPRNKKFYDMTSVLTISSDHDFIDFRRIQTKNLKSSKTFNVTALLKKPSQSIIVIIASENIAGSSKHVEFKPNIPPSEFPVPRTRPLTSMELDLEGLEDDPDFWEMGIDDSSEDQPQPEPKLEPKARQKIEGGRVEESKAGIQFDPPRKLPNGNYECNHSCHDKGHCRHFCCRQGLPDRPGLPKKYKEKERALGTTAETSTSRADSNEKKSGTGVKRLHKVSAAITKGAKNLDDYHQNASVTQSLCLSTGQRLKLDDPVRAIAERKKTRAKPNYDLSFADLGESSLQSFHALDSDEDHISDDDLPESIIAHLATAKGRPTPTQGTRLTREPKRTLSAISLSSDGDDAKPPPAAQPSKRAKQAPSLEGESLVDVKISLSSDEDVHSSSATQPFAKAASSLTTQAAESDDLLFIPGENNDSVAGDSPSAPNLMEDIEEYMGVVPATTSEEQIERVCFKDEPRGTVLVPGSSDTMTGAVELNEDESTVEVDEDWVDLEQWLNGGSKVV